MAVWVTEGVVDETQGVTDVLGPLNPIYYNESHPTDDIVARWARNIATRPNGWGMVIGENRRYFLLVSERHCWFIYRKR